MSGNKIGIGSTPGVDRSNKSLSGSDTESIYGRVYSVLLTNDSKLAEDMGVPVGTIGAIQFRFIKNGEVNESSPMQTALHINSANRRFPIKNEIVVITSGPTYKSNNAKGNNTYTFYYKDIVDIWDSAEHNSIPDTRNESDVTGTSFKEKGNIARLLHAPGDFVQEGRFGNSFRIGASTDSVTDIPWKGPNGSPVCIIRNGQNKNLPKDVKLSTEDINNDGSSIYMLSEQVIDFIPASLNFDSYGQEINSVTKSDIVVVRAELNNKPEVSNTVSDKIDNKAITDTLPQKYDTPVVVPVNSADEELIFLPDKEDTQFYQELEDEGPRHTGDNSEWINAISADSVDISNVSRQSGRMSFSTPFIAYMQHQQGSGGLKAILRSAKVGDLKVPLKNGTKEDIQYNMSKNVGSDFKGIPLTPANFLSYWNNKFEARLRKSYRVNPTIDAILVKYANLYNVPINFVRAVCNTESSFNPNNKGNGKYQGLFQLDKSEFNKVYPNDTDIFNADKNANVGIRLLRSYLSSASTLLNSVR